MALARIGLLVFGSVWPKWKGLPRSIRTTHPDVLPSTTKHSNRCELDGVDRITGQHRDSTECHIILLVSSAQFSRVEASWVEFWHEEWVSMERGCNICNWGCDCDTFAIVVTALNCTSRQKSHVTEWDVRCAKSGGKLCIKLLPKISSHRECLIRWPPFESSLISHPGKFADLAALSPLRECWPRLLARLQFWPLSR